MVLEVAGGADEGNEISGEERAEAGLTTEHTEYTEKKARVPSYSSVYPW
jgi:hypothetical protein